MTKPFKKLTDGFLRSPIQYIKIDFTTVTVTDFEVNLSGETLITVVEATNSKDLTIKFNNLISNPVPFSHNDRFVVDFERFYITGRVNNGTLKFYALQSKEYDVQKNNQNEWGGQDVEIVLAGNAVVPYTRVLGIYVMSLGNVVAQFNGTNRTFSNVPTGTFLPISPEAIQNTTTSDLAIIYCE